ncbi:MAG: hypothetical protein ACI4JB_04580 [Porcipelethomonas sp.]
MKKICIPILILTMLLTGCQSGINYDSIKGESYWQGAQIDPIIDDESDSYRDFNSGKGKLYNGKFYWKQREDVEDGLIFDIDMPEIKNGKYYFTDGNGYVEIKDHKSFRLVGLDDERIKELKVYYSKGGYGHYIYSHPDASTAEKEKIKEQCENSRQIEDILINNYADFYINLLPYVPEETGTEIELTCELSDFDMWFPLQYQHRSDPPRLLYQEFEWIFEYKGDQL